MLESFRFSQNNVQASRALFLYHGTGGNENDLLPLVQPFLETHVVVGLRGNVQDEGRNRFFHRFPDGSFDQTSIQSESEKFLEFLSAWVDTYSIEPKNITHIGYSNGANFILANLFTSPQMMGQCAILHGMLPFPPPSEAKLQHHEIFASWSPNDPLITAEQSRQLIDTLRSLGAELTEFQGNAGHSPTQEEILALHRFIH